jgi:hypothetical protein
VTFSRPNEARVRFDDVTGDEQPTARLIAANAGITSAVFPRRRPARLTPYDRSHEERSDEQVVDESEADVAGELSADAARGLPCRSPPARGTARVRLRELGVGQICDRPAATRRLSGEPIIRLDGVGPRSGRAATSPADSGNGTGDWTSAATISAGFDGQR